MVLRFICIVGFGFVWFAAPAARGQESLEDLNQRAIAAYRGGEIDEAFALANQAIEKAPADPTGYFIRGTVYESRQEYDRALADLNQVASASPTLALAYSRRGALHFKRGEFDASIADFDREIKLDPAAKQNHWQRGISYYYAGRYEDGRRQFELAYQTANPDDYENGIFQFLCVAKARGIEKARKSMLDISGDKRVPMKELYALYRGTGSVGAVMDATEVGYPNAVDLKNRLFYAHLYISLYEDVAGEIDSARGHVRRAVENFPITHYMWDVARIQLRQLGAGDQAGEPATVTPGTP
jgi:lipoprotein NlpI